MIKSTTFRLNKTVALFKYAFPKVTLFVRFMTLILAVCLLYSKLESVKLLFGQASSKCDVDDTAILVEAKESDTTNLMTVDITISNKSNQPIKITRVTTEIKYNDGVNDNPLDLTNLTCAQTFVSCTSSQGRVEINPKSPNTSINLEKIGNKGDSVKLTYTVYPGSPLSNARVSVNAQGDYVTNCKTNSKSSSFQFIPHDSVASKSQSGIISLDWGDFDRDGNLDLVNATYNTVTVYKYSNGLPIKFWETKIKAAAVRWVDVDRQTPGQELIVSSYESDSTTSEYANYVFRYNSITRQFVGSPFFTSGILSKFEPVKFTPNGFVNLVASTYEPSTSCRIRKFYDDLQTGLFSQGNSVCLQYYYGIWPIAVTDFENNDKLDIAVDLPYFNTYYVAINQPIEQLFKLFDYSSIMADFFDFAWGDFNQDGYLDLAAAIPDSQEAVIFQNTQSSSGARALKLYDVVSTNVPGTPFSVEWGDYNADGLLDLVVVDHDPASTSTKGQIKIFINQPSAAHRFSDNSPVLVEYSGSLDTSQLIRLVDYDNNGSLDISGFTNKPNNQLSLNTILVSLPGQPPPRPSTSVPASSVIWGDVDNNGYPDLILGSSTNDVNAPKFNKLFLNYGGTYNSLLNSERYLPLGDNSPDYVNCTGGQSIALADYDRNGQLDLAMYAGDLCQAIWLIRDIGDRVNTGFPALKLQVLNVDRSVSSLAWGDLNGDGYLELAVGLSDGALLLYKNNNGQISTSAITIASAVSQSDNVITSIAWGDFDADHHMDLVVGRSNKASQFFYNQNGESLVLYPTDLANLPVADTRAIAWSDFDQDGYLDLTVANYSAESIIYKYCSDVGNYGSIDCEKKGQFVAYHFTSKINNTTSIAWGDVNGDGVADLALGNENQPTQVYINSPGTPISNKLGSQPAWESKETYKTSAVIWTDIDQDGDLDLVVSQDGNGINGYYENNYIHATSQIYDFRTTIPLLNQSSYVSVKRPGTTPSSDLYSSSEILSGPQYPTVTVEYKLYDPDGSRMLLPSDNQPGNLGAVGTPIYTPTSTIEYSLDGGGTWEKIEQPGQSLVPTTTRKGFPATFEWNAVKDQAISDNARIRIRIVYDDPFGPVQRASATAISPPFRVRGTSCYWPIDPAIEITSRAGIPTTEDSYANLNQMRLTGKIAQGSGVIHYEWHVDSPTQTVASKQGQRIDFREFNVPFDTNQTYTVTLMVTGDPCPITREVSTHQQMSIPRAYLPIIASNDTSADQTEQQALTAIAAETQKVELFPANLAQVTGLRGTENNKLIDLAWDAYQEHQNILGFHVYRGLHNSPEESYTLIATLPANTIHFTDSAPLCDGDYYVTAYSSEGDSLPSTASFYALPCP